MDTASPGSILPTLDPGTTPQTAKVMGFHGPGRNRAGVEGQGGTEVLETGTTLLPIVDPQQTLARNT
jgi:hypothetical protein